MNQTLNIKMIREAVYQLRRYDLPKESCGCQEVLPEVKLTCQQHQRPLTQNEIMVANMSLQRFFCNLS